MPSTLQAIPPQSTRGRRPEPPSGEASDARLLARYASDGSSGRRDARRFVRRFQGRVFGLARLILADDRTAATVARDALLQAKRDADLFDPRRDTVTSWLLRITRTLATEARRMSEPRAIDLDGMFADDAFGDLPDELWRALLLAGLLGLDAREIAEWEGIPVTAARDRLRRALMHMRLQSREQPEREARQ